MTNKPRYLKLYEIASEIKPNKVYYIDTSCTELIGITPSNDTCGVKCIGTHKVIGVRLRWVIRKNGLKWKFYDSESFPVFAKFTSNSIREATEEEIEVYNKLTSRYRKQTFLEKHPRIAKLIPRFMISKR